MKLFANLALLVSPLLILFVGTSAAFGTRGQGADARSSILSQKERRARSMKDPPGGKRNPGAPDDYRRSIILSVTGVKNPDSLTLELDNVETGIVAYKSDLQVWDSNGQQRVGGLLPGAYTLTVSSPEEIANGSIIIEDAANFEPIYSYDGAFVDGITVFDAPIAL